MKKLLIDIETYSDIDLPSCGLYRYVESPKFCVLLFSYSVDFGPAQIVDLANGETIPTEILSACYDPNVKKYAHNMAFELTCLGKHFGKALDPRQWWDTMAYAAYLGLPLSLGQLGEVLNLNQQKLSEGKNLILYFSKPYRGERKMPSDNPEKWEAFKRYCLRDVDSEVEVARKIGDRVHVPEWERRVQLADLAINSRGVRVDDTLARNAVLFWSRLEEELVARAKELTGLENPNSVTQLKEWCRRSGVRVDDTLDKAAIKELLGHFLPGRVREMLEIRKELGKTSVKKYQAMLNMQCQDGRVRGLTKYYGTFTGRFCLTGDHEVLTPTGWVRLGEWRGGKIACWRPDTEQISFSEATPNEFDYTGDMIEINHQRCQQLSTPEHKMAYCTRTKTDWKTEQVRNLCKSIEIPFWGNMPRLSSNDDLSLRILIMTQADGYYCEDGQLIFSFKKERKIERCKHLLRRAGIVFSNRIYGGVTKIVIKKRDLPMYLRIFRNKTFGWWLMYENPDTIFDELPYWDGYHCGPNSIQYSSINRQNIDLLQALAVTSGRSATIVTKRANSEKWSDSYALNVWNTPGRSAALRAQDFKRVPFDGKVYCPTTSSGFFLVRRNGACWITGNSGSGVQLQNLPQNHLEDLGYARELLRSGNYEEMELGYPSVSDTLSQLVRTALIPSEGNVFHICDFSAIEARVTAWLSGEEWVLDAFRKGEDIYCITAGRMFGCEVTKHGPNGYLRQPGKVAVLACGYGGGPAAFESMAKNYGLKFTEEEKVTYVKQWRKANPNTVRLWGVLEKAAIACIQTGQTVRVNRGIEFSFRFGFLFVKLPSGRSIAYPRAKVSEGEKGPRITYERLNQTTKKWEVAETYGGKILENSIQSIARDILCIVLLKCEERGHPIVFHVHDEVIIDSPRQDALAEIEEIFSEPIPWAPGLPLKGSGYSGAYYFKD